MASTGTLLPSRQLPQQGDLDERVRDILLALLKTASKAARRLGYRGDEESLHDLRTALRRTRSVLKAYRGALGRRARRFERELREIARSTAAGRDAEVQLEWLKQRAAARPSHAASSLEPLRERLKRERRRGYEVARAEAVPAFRLLAGKMDRWLREKRPSHVRGDGHSLEFGPFTAGVLREAAAGLVSRLDAVASERDEASLHSARIRGKRLRYVLEPLEGEHPPAHEALVQLKALQIILGDIHDRHVLQKLLRGTPRPGEKKGVRRISLVPRRGSALRTARARATAELRQRFGDLRREWLDGGVEKLLEQIEQLASELEAGDVEIERKFLLTHLPEEVRGAPVAEIWQGWIPGERLQERLRRVKRDGQEDLFRTVKLGRGIERTEIEEQTAPAVFERMWPLTEGRRVLKRRYVVEDAGRRWEIDEFLDRPLYLAEVELPAAGAEVRLPKWLARAVEREVTGEDAFVNVNLAR